ncbi:FK506-binding 5-like isoform X1 [Paramuricea clavata]|uniref:FK506-binding 5-like isoform X1 n=1 Tax=Paramuricea clavata TaxID=317549 RepID=A0A7D9E592_PARCT|nr:FK506-binding 5-like isoform X1 [Paramuricea clavata]
MVGRESQRKLLHNVRPMSEPCSILKSNSQYQRTSQNSGNKNKQSMVKTQTGRQRDVRRSYHAPTKSNAYDKQYCSQTLVCTRPHSRNTSSQLTSLGAKPLQKNATTQSSLNNGAKLYTKTSNSNFVSNYGRCLSAPSTRSFYRTSEQHHAKCTLEGELINGSKVNLRTKHRCMSAPKISRNVLSVCNTLTKASPSNRQTVHPRSAEKFSNSLLSKTIEFDKESMSDVMSFSDDIIELQLDACSTSDDSSVVDVRWRPRSCISFRRVVELVPNSKHHCVTPLKNRPHSSPNPRQRVKAKLTDPYNFRRGNVPKYISFVEPMPVHERPGTGKSSGYGSSGISMVSEDLLVSAGTQGELADSGEESEQELDNGYENLLPCDGVDPRTADIDDASLEAMMSSRSSFNKSELDGSFLDGEGSNMDGDGTEDNMFSGEDQDRLDSAEQRSGYGLNGNGDFTEIDPALFGEALDSNENNKSIGEDDVDADKLGDSLGTNGTENWDQNDGNIDERNGGLDDSMGLLNDSEQEKLDAESAFDTNAIDNESPTDQLDSAENDLQVTFSEPLATDRRLSTNDTENGTKSPKSILKGTVNDKNRIFEHELDPSIMRRLTSPEETEKPPTKPTMARRSADLRPQSKPDILLPDHDSQAQSRSKQTTDQEAEQTSSDDDGLSDSDFYSSTGRRRPKPKSNIYSKRTKLKPPSQKLRKRKGSNNSDNDDVIMSAESALLMEQILEEEKRLREGMKPWLKGRLALSQQNSRFEIPMDVRLLETMTPMEYLTKYCVISKRRKALYQHVFQKVDKNRDGIITFTELEKGLKDVHTGILDSQHVENIVEMVLIDKEEDFDLKKFSAIAAFSERISCKDQLPVEMLNNFDGQKEVIECADFFALNWKLDGIKVNPDVKKILDSL